MQMKEEGFRPNIWTYKKMLLALISKDLLTEALDIFSQMECKFYFMIFS